MRWSTEFRSGDVTNGETMDGITTFELPGSNGIEKGEIIEVLTRKLHIELYCNDVVVLDDEYDLSWNERVCNTCTDRPWCDDGKVTNASLSIDVDPTGFPVNQN